MIFEPLYLIRIDLIFVHLKYKSIGPGGPNPASGWPKSGGSSDGPSGCPDMDPPSRICRFWILEIRGSSKQDPPKWILRWTIRLSGNTIPDFQSPTKSVHPIYRSSRNPTRMKMPVAESWYSILISPTGPCVTSIWIGTEPHWPRRCPRPLRQLRFSWLRSLFCFPTWIYGRLHYPRRRRSI